MPVIPGWSIRGKLSGRRKKPKVDWEKEKCHVEETKHKTEFGPPERNVKYLSLYTLT